MLGFIIQTRTVQLGPGVSVIASAWGVSIRVIPQPGKNGNRIRRRRRGVKELGFSVLSSRRRKPVLPSLDPVPTTSLVAEQRSTDNSVSTNLRPQGVKRKRCSDGSDSALATIGSLAKRVKSYVDTDFKAIQQKYNPDGTLTRSQLDAMIIRQQEKVRLLEEKQCLAELGVVSVPFSKEQQSEYQTEIDINDYLGSQFFNHQTNDLFYPSDGLGVSNWMDYIGQSWPCHNTQNMVIFGNQNEMNWMNGFVSEGMAVS